MRQKIANFQQKEMSNSVEIRTLEGKIRETEKCAAQLSDSRILSKLAAGDMVAQDAVYHSLCLKDYYRRPKKRQAMEKREENEQ